MTLEQALIAAVIALAGAVGILWTWMVGQVNEMNERAEKCEESRAELSEKIGSMAMQLTFLAAKVASKEHALKRAEAASCDIEDCNMRRRVGKGGGDTWDDMKIFHVNVRDK